MARLAKKYSNSTVHVYIDYVLHIVIFRASHYVVRSSFEMSYAAAHLLVCPFAPFHYIRDRAVGKSEKYGGEVSSRTVLSPEVPERSWDGTGQDRTGPRDPNGPGTKKSREDQKFRDFI